MNIGFHGHNNFLLLFFLTSLWSENGTAVAYLMAELSVLLSLAVIGRQFIPITYIKTSYIKYLLSAFMMGVVVLFCNQFSINIYLRFGVASFWGALVYALSLYLLKDAMLKEVFNTIKNKFLSR